MALPIVPIIGGIGAGLGFLQTLQARRMERNNPRPLDTVNNNLLKNQAIASQMANNGLPQEAYNQALMQQQQGLATGLRSLNSRGVNSYNVNSMLRNYQQGINQLNVADANARQTNQRVLMNANSALAQEEQRVFNVNRMQPWQYTAGLVAQQRQQGMRNITGGIGLLAQYGLMKQFGNPNGQGDGASNTGYGGLF